MNSSSRPANWIEVGDTIWSRPCHQRDSQIEQSHSWEQDILVTAVEPEVRIRDESGDERALDTTREEFVALPPTESLPQDLQEILARHSNLAAVRDRTVLSGTRELARYQLFCRDCRDRLWIEQSSVEASDLRFEEEQGFSQGKPAIVDGGSCVRCSCATKDPLAEEPAPLTYDIEFEAH